MGEIRYYNAQAMYSFELLAYSEWTMALHYAIVCEEDAQEEGTEH